jgi:hypothetical protein
MRFVAVGSTLILISYASLALAQTPSPDVVPVPVAEAPPEAALPKKLAVGKQGFLVPGVQLQFWTYAQRQNLNGEQDLTSYFRIRRAEIRVKGEIVPGLFAYNVMVDPARALEFDTRNIGVTPVDPAQAQPGTVSLAQPNGATTIFQDLILTFLSDYADVSFGQFKLPIGYEAYNNTARLIMPEFALVTRYFSARRDLGIKVDKKLGDYFYYRLDLLNGAGQNRLDNDDQKDGAVRLEAYPFPGLTLGVAGYAGLNRRADSVTKDRLEADLRLDYANVLVQGEFIHGWDGATGGARSEARGFYGALGYTFAKKLQPLVRVGHLNPRVSGAAPSAITTSNDRVWSYEAGVNYFIQGYDLELQLSAGVFDYQTVANIYHGIFEVQVAF